MFPTFHPTAKCSNKLCEKNRIFFSWNKIIFFWRRGVGFAHIMKQHTATDSQFCSLQRTTAEPTMLTVLCYSPVVAAVSVTCPSKVMTQMSCTQLLHRHIVTSRRCLDVNNAGRICDFTLRLPGIRQIFVVLSQFVEVRFPSYFTTCLRFSRNDRTKSEDSADAMIVT